MSTYLCMERLSGLAKSKSSVQMKVVPAKNPPPRPMPEEPAKWSGREYAWDYPGETIALSVTPVGTPNASYYSDVVYWRPKDMDDFARYMAANPDTDMEGWRDIVQYFKDDPEVYFWLSY